MLNWSVNQSEWFGEMRTQANELIAIIIFKSQLVANCSVFIQSKPNCTSQMKKIA